MADDAKVLSLNWPAPPPFYKHFTVANCERVREATKHGETSSVEASLLSTVLADTPELQFLVPPARPEDGRYSAFEEHNEVRCSSILIFHTF